MTRLRRFWKVRRGGEGERGKGGEGGRWRGGEADFEFLFCTTTDGEASLEDLLDQAVDYDEEGVDSLYLCISSLTLHHLTP
jgi:hypothetical protein